MSVELRLLAWSVILLLAYIMAQGALVIPVRGLGWNAGPRDGGQGPLPTHAGRAQRALDNFKESWPAFIALTLALAIAGRTGGAGALGAWIWFVARIVYLPLYLLGVRWLRTLSYGASWVGLFIMLGRLL
jgi:uncharacterized MAPEG superfamily protein